MKHDGCKLCKYEKCSMESKECMGCKQNAVDKYIRITNADRIRSMSDEEFAEFFENEITMPDDGLYLIIEGKQIWNKYDMLAWLQSEVEETDER